MVKKLCIILAGLSVALAGAAGAQERLTGSSAAIEKALSMYAREMDGRTTDQDSQVKAVPRADKAEAAVIGAIAFVDSTHFLSDGTPFRIVAVHTSKPFGQDVFVVCLGSSFNSTCGRLGIGRRASFTADVLVVQSGSSAGLALFVVKRLQT